MRSVFLVLGASTLIAASPLLARKDGNSNFQLTCALRTKNVHISTEGGALVYRFGTSNRIELQIRENRSGSSNVFYRYDLLGTKGSGQQLRFTNAEYSYGLKSWFIAGADGDEGLAFFVLKNGKLVEWRDCKGNGWFTEDNQLQRLTHDPLWISREGTSTGDVPGVTPWNPS